MRAASPRLGWTLLGAMATLGLGACGDTVAPTMSTPASSASATPTPITPSAAVRGLVVDASGRPLPSVFVRAQNPPDASDDPPLSSAKTDASGSFRLNVTEPLFGGRFTLGASLPGYKAVWKDLRIPDSTCTWDNKHCDLAANFTLTPQ